MKNILLRLLILSPFLDGFYWRGLFPFDVYFYYIIFVAALFFSIFSLGKFPYPGNWIVLPLLVIIVSGFLVNTSLSLGNPRFFIQLLGIFFSAIAYSCVFYFEKDTSRIVRIYYRTALTMAYMGIAQFILILLGLGIGNYVIDENFPAPRIALVSGEPYFFAISLLPGAYMAVSEWFSKKNERMFSGGLVTLNSVAFLVAVLLTFSTAGLLGLGLLFVVKIFNVIKLKFRFKHIAISLIVGVGLFAYLQRNYKGSGMERRIEQTIDVLSDPLAFKKYGSHINASTFSLYSNLYVARESFKANPLTGGGIGSHPVQYDRYIFSLVPKEVMENYGVKFNNMDANSLFLRLMSETGLIGLFLFGFFLWRYRVRIESDWIGNLNSGLFILFILRLVRTGNYIGNGMFLFMYLYRKSKLECTKPSASN